MLVSQPLSFRHADDASASPFFGELAVKNARLRGLDATEFAHIIGQGDAVDIGGTLGECLRVCMCVLRRGSA